MSRHDPNVFLPRIEELARAGLTPNGIAEVIRREFENAPTRMTISSWIKKYNIQAKTRAEQDTKRYHEALALINEGMRINDIRKLGYSYELIIRVAKENGINLKRRSEAAEERALTKEEVLARLPRDQTYQYLGREYGKYKIMAEDGTIFYKSATRLHQGQPKRVRSARSFAKKLLEQTGKTLIEDSFAGVKKSALVMCSSGKHKIQYAMAEGALQHVNCPYCNNTGISLAEQELAKWIESLGFKVERLSLPKDPKQAGRSKEIDIYIPSLRIGIEYCGLYYHSEKSRSDETTELEYAAYLYEMKHKHNSKRLTCNALGIRLITIFEDEWISRKNQVKGFLKSVLGISDTKIDARKCQIEELDLRVASSFIDRHHIQGSNKSTTLVAFGLRFNGTLVATITGNRHHRSGGSGVLVLGRLCFADGANVRGGSSRLLSALKNWALSNGYHTIISWSDNRWSEGRVYQALGFKMEKEGGPDYSYVLSGDNSARYSKQSLKKSGLDYQTGLTERELRIKEGFARIWDCGKKRWVMRIK